MKYFAILVICFFGFKSVKSQGVTDPLHLKLVCSKNSSGFYRTNSFFKKICPFAIEDSLESCSNINHSISAYNESDISCTVIKFHSLDTLTKVLDSINRFIERGYLFFDNDYDDSLYKGYLEFVDRGVIITYNKRLSELILVNSNTCIFEKNKAKVTKIIKRWYPGSLAFCFECGGKRLAYVIK